MISESWFAQLAVSLVVATVSSALTVYFSLRRFYREKWWEKRYEAYANAIAAVVELQSALTSPALTGEELPADEVPTEKLLLRISALEAQGAALKGVQDAISNGLLLLSPEMFRLLGSIAPRLKSTDAAPVDTLALMASIVFDANKIARKDLGLPRAAI